MSSSKTSEKSAKSLHPRLRARMNARQVSMFENAQEVPEQDQKKNSPPAEQQVGEGKDAAPDQVSKVEKAPEAESVTDLCKRVKSSLKQHVGSVYVKGEIADFKGIHRSGHLYCSLKDESSQIRMVMWKGALAKVPFQVEGGLEVIVRGKIDFYAGSGSIQISVDRLEPVGTGALQLKFEQLKKKLSEEGLFDDERKRPIPSVCWRLGIVTGKSTAALQDILRVLGQRFPMTEVCVFQASVQGAKAPADVVAAIESANRYSKENKLDAILLARGGGSYEDLFCFNDEAIARAIVASELPVVTGIGHEIDYTIADFVADKRAATPSHAAQEVVPDVRQWYERLEDLGELFPSRVRDLIEELQDTVDRAYDKIVQRAPHKRIERDQELLASKKQRLQELMSYQLQNKKNQIAQISAVLDALSPLKVLERGYSVVQDASKKALKSVKQVSKGDKLSLTVQDGQIDAVVDSVKS